MALYKNIFLTIDCSGTDDIIIEHVIKLAKIHGSKVKLFHVVHAHTLEQDNYLYKTSREYIDKYISSFAKEDIKVDFTIKKGEPEIEILEEINNGEYDLIAMATHGHNFLLDMLYGSVSDTLKHKTNIPILLIKSPS